jgi:nucleoside-diphosphate-sugar epimerase
MWKNLKVCVTGGASFIGSHLVEALVHRGAKVFVADNLSSGKLAYLQPLIDQGLIKFSDCDLRWGKNCFTAVRHRDVVFHLAADHGGRGYVDLHQAACATNLGLDSAVFRACLKSHGPGKIVFASSGCVYPNYLQTDPKKELYLTEDMVGPPYDSDGMYGYAKLMAEKTLQAFHQDHKLKSASCRIFTVIGPRMKEDHAICAMIARAFIRQAPFEIWGSGNQIRNWTYVSDVVRGLLLAAEKIEHGTAVNIGTMERTTVLEAAAQVCTLLGHATGIYARPDMPTGPLNRVADNRLAQQLLGWVPEVPFSDGLRKTIEWYVQTHTRDGVAGRLERALTER